MAWTLNCVYMRTQGSRFIPPTPYSLPRKPGDGLTAELTEEGTIPDETFQKAMVRTEAEALAAANRIGYPVMLKASEGA